MKFMVINGPNLNMVGIREPSVYGKKTYGEIETATKASAATISRVNKCLQYGAGGYTRVLKRIQEQEANDEQ